MKTAKKKKAKVSKKKNALFPTFKDGYMASQIAHHIHNNQMSKVTIK